MVVVLGAAHEHPCIDVSLSGADWQTRGRLAADSLNAVSLFHADLVALPFIGVVTSISAPVDLPATVGLSPPALARTTVLQI